MLYFIYKTDFFHRSYGQALFNLFFDRVLNGVITRAGNHFPNQAQRKRLSAHDNQQHSQKQQRPVPDAVALKPRVIPSGSLAVGKPAKASNVFHNMARYGADKAFDDDPATRWATDEGTYAAWIEMDLGAVRRIGRIHIREAYP